MELKNQTDFPARMLVGSTGEREMLGIVVCKVTYVLEDGWLIAITGDQAWPVFEKPFVFKDITLGPELDFRKNGVDIIVFGVAAAPGGNPVTQMPVAVDYGKRRHEVVVFGDRVWKKAYGRLVCSEPKPFTEMPLTNDRAYGGTTKVDDVEVAHAVNPGGHGFCMSAKSVKGTLLPNLERQEALIQEWSDQPAPACFFKPAGLMIDPDKVVEAEDVVIGEVMCSLFNQAAPDLVARPEDLGETLRLVGFCAEGDLVFPMPRLNGPSVHVVVGNLRSQFPSTISSLVVLARERVLIVTYLALFRYLFRPQEKRAAKLQWSEDPMMRPVQLDAAGRRVS